MRNVNIFQMAGILGVSVKAKYVEKNGNVNPKRPVTAYKVYNRY